MQSITKKFLIFSLSSVFFFFLFVQPVFAGCYYNYSNETNAGTTTQRGCFYSTPPHSHVVHTSFLTQNYNDKLSETTVFSFTDTPYFRIHNSEVTYVYKTSNTNCSTPDCWLYGLPTEHGEAFCWTKTGASSNFFSTYPTSTAFVYESTFQVLSCFRNTLLPTTASSTPIPGCTDPEAENYNPEATTDDDSCYYQEPDPPISSVTSCITNNVWVGNTLYSAISLRNTSETFRELTLNVCPFDPNFSINSLNSTLIGSDKDWFSIPAYSTGCKYIIRFGDAPTSFASFCQNSSCATQGLLSDFNLPTLYFSLTIDDFSIIEQDRTYLYTARTLNPQLGLRNYGICAKDSTLSVFPPNNTATYFIGNPRVDETAQTMTANLYGDVGYTSENSYCVLDVFHETKNVPNIANGISEFPVAKIHISSLTPRADTLFKGNGEYLGHGYNSVSSQWIADDVVLPYTPGGNNSYPISFTCYEDEYSCTDDNCFKTGQKIVAQGNGLRGIAPGQYSPELVGEIDEDIESIEQCDNLDIFCKFRVWFTAFFKSLFIGDLELTAQKINAVRANMINRAPFAYAYAVFSLDFESVEIPTTTPTITIPLKTGQVMHKLSYNIESDNSNYAFNSFRNFMQITIWAFFVAYLVYYARRIF